MNRGLTDARPDLTAWESSHARGKLRLRNFPAGDLLTTMSIPRNTQRLARAIIVCALPKLAASAVAAIAYTIPESTYLQNFDSLPNTPQNVSLGTTASGAGWIDDTVTPAVGQFSIPGWYLYHPIDQSAGEGGVNGHQRLRIGAGTSGTGAFMSFGVSGSTDRALGDVGSTTLGANGSDLYIGLRLRNDTGQILDSITISYHGEQWRDGGAATPVAQDMTFAWSTTALAISDAPALFNSVPQLGYSSPVFVNTGSGAAVDGNTSGLVEIAPFTISGVNWLPGTDLWLRWTDVSNPGNDHGLAIDELSFSASTVPEPSSAALLLVGLAGLLSRHRRPSPSVG
jgi:hypothetical protein